MKCCYLSTEGVYPGGCRTQAEDSRVAAGVPPSTGSADDGAAGAAATAAAGQQGLQYLAALPPGIAPASNRSVAWFLQHCLLA